MGKKYAIDHFMQFLTTGKVDFDEVKKRFEEDTEDYFLGPFYTDCWGNLTKEEIEDRIDNLKKYKDEEKKGD